MRWSWRYDGHLFFSRDESKALNPLSVGSLSDERNRLDGLRFPGREAKQYQRVPVDHTL
jgi:hypothetical protein